MPHVGQVIERPMRHTMRLRDGWRDSELYAVLEDEWRARQAGR